MQWRLDDYIKQADESARYLLPYRGGKTADHPTGIAIIIKPNRQDGSP